MTLTDDLSSAIDIVDASCNICIQHGRPLPSKKIPLTHVNGALNEEIQLDFTYAVVYRKSPNGANEYTREKHILLVMTDTGTRYTEATIVNDRTVSTIVSVYEKHWLCRCFKAPVRGRRISPPCLDQLSRNAWHRISSPAISTTQQE